MLDMKLILAALAVVSCGGLFSGCQTTPQHYDQPRIEARSPDQQSHHRFWRSNYEGKGPMWHRAEINQQSHLACSGKSAGQAVTINLQNGKTIQGTCNLRFEPIPPLNSR